MGTFSGHPWGHSLATTGDFHTATDSSAGGRLTGIDYLATLAERHRSQVLHDMRLADPTGAAAGLTPWQAINVLTAGCLLTARSG